MKRPGFLAGTAALIAAPVTAQSLSTSDAIARLFTSPALQPSWFSKTFLAAVPIATMKSILGDIVATLGPYQSIAPNGSRYTLTFATGTMQAEGLLDTTGAFTGLLFSRMQSPAVAARLASIFTTNPVPPAWFSDAFLAAVPITQIRSVIASVKSQGGTFTAVAPKPDGSYQVLFAHASFTALAALDRDGKFEGLILQPGS